MGINTSGFISKSTRVVDERDKPLEGAHIYWENGTKGTTTNANGEANLVTPVDQKVTISFVGKYKDNYQVSQLPPKIIMMDKIQTLGEVVLTNKPKSTTPKYLWPALGATALLMIVMSLGSEPKKVTL